MPALICCRKRWNAGSDDFVFSSAIAILIRMVCLISAILLLISSLSTRIPVCQLADNSFFALILIYWCLWIVTQVIVLGLEAAIMTISARGRIFELHKRSALPIYLCIRVVFYIVEVLLTIFGTFVASSVDLFISQQDQDSLLYQHCSYMNELLTGTKIFVGISWTLLVIIIILFLYYFDPFGMCTLHKGLETEIEDEEQLNRARNLLLVNSARPRRAGGDDITVHTSRKVGRSTRKLYYNQSVEQQYYIKKFKKLFKCFNETDSLSLAFRDIATGLSILFHGSKDYVISDLVAGLKLLSKKQDIPDYFQRESVKMREWTLEIISNDPKMAVPGYTYNEPRLLNFLQEAEREMFTVGLYYLKYAIGIYGWPIHVFLNPCCGLGGLCHLASCRWKQPRAGDTLLHDNCLMMNTAALLLETEVNEREVLFCSYDNDVHIKPFSVIADTEKKTIVLTVRGSMSIRDTFTDMTMSLKKLDVPEEPFSNLRTYAHLGLFNSAVTIKNFLNDREVLRNAFERYQNYTLVICGHSLGAGIAAVLSVMLKEDYPDLKCYCFSPVGGTFSFPLMEYSKSFITSYIVGNDVIGRLSVRSLIHMTNSLSVNLQQCQIPKYQILLGSFGEKLVNFLKCGNTEIDAAFVCKDQDTDYDKEEGLARKYARKWYENTKREAEKRLKNFIKRQENIPLFPPGKVLLLQKKEKEQQMRFCYSKEREIEVFLCANEDFSTIKLGKDMLDDHVPDAVVKAFERVHDQYIKTTAFAEDDIDAIV